MTTAIRTPAVAGRFYPRDADELRRDVLQYTTANDDKKLIPAIGCIAPHAGYMYSGHVAGTVYAQMKFRAA
jgi:AmmeMemoRadiSam system protein B